MNPNTDERKKVIFYIGNTLSDKTRLHQNYKHNNKTISQPQNTEAHTIKVCSEANITIHRHTNSVINYNAIIQLIFNILEQVF
jgi:UDP-N-acetylglucosamine 2-epimerase